MIACSICLIARVVSFRPDKAFPSRICARALDPSAFQRQRRAPGFVELRGHQHQLTRLLSCASTLRVEIGSLASSQPYTLTASPVSMYSAGELVMDVGA